MVFPLFSTLMLRPAFMYSKQTVNSNWKWFQRQYYFFLWHCYFKYLMSDWNNECKLGGRVELNVKSNPYSFQRELKNSMKKLDRKIS